MAERHASTGLVHIVVAIVGTLAFASALGAVWTALLLRMPSAHYWFALAAGAFLGHGIRAWFTPRRGLAMALATAGLLLAAAYMQILFVGLELAAVMGLDKLDALRRAGPAMLLALAWAASGWHLALPVAGGIVVALWLVWRHRDGARIRRHQAP